MVWYVMAVPYRFPPRLCILRAYAIGKHRSVTDVSHLLQLLEVSVEPDAVEGRGEAIVDKLDVVGLVGSCREGRRDAA